MDIRELFYRIRSTKLLSVMHMLYSYRDMAVRLGMTPSAISKYIRGHALPSLATARRIHEAFSRDKELLSHLSRMLLEEPELALLEDIAEALVMLLEQKYSSRLSSIDTVASMVDPSIGVATLLASRRGVDLLLVYTPPLIPAASTFCMTLQEPSMRLPLCIDARKRRALKGQRILLVYPLALPPNTAPRLAEALAGGLQAAGLELVMIACAEENPCMAGRNCVCILGDDSGFKCRGGMGRE